MLAINTDVHEITEIKKKSINTFVQLSKWLNHNVVWEKINIVLRNEWSSFIKLEPLYQRIVSAKIGWSWHIGSEEEDFSSMYFCYFFIISP